MNQADLEAVIARALWDALTRGETLTARINSLERRIATLELRQPQPAWKRDVVRLRQTIRAATIRAATVRERSPETERSDS